MRGQPSEVTLKEMTRIVNDELNTEKYTGSHARLSHSQIGYIIETADSFGQVKDDFTNVINPQIEGIGYKLERL